MRFYVDRHPDFVRSLGGQAVELKSGEQADHVAWNLRCRHRKTVVFRHRGISEHVHTARASGQDAFAEQTKESLSRNPFVLDVPGAYDSATARNLKNPLG